MVPCPQPAGGWLPQQVVPSPPLVHEMFFQSHLCHPSRKVIAVKDAAFSVLQPVWIILNRPKYLLVFKAPRVSYCYPNWKACAVCHSLYKCVLESRAVAILYKVHLKNKTNQTSPWFQLYIYAGFLPDLFPDPDHSGVCFSHLLLCKGEYCGFFVVL